MSVVKSFRKVCLFILLGVITGGCGRAKGSSSRYEGLTIGLMPAADAAPFLIAEKEGYFDELGLPVELIIFQNALERQAALQSGQIDGGISDIVALINNVDNGFPIKATSCTDGSFLLVLGGSFDQGAEEITLGLMEVSVVNYLAEQFLGEAYKLNKIYINEIPARIEMLTKGQIDGAVLPEPVATNAELMGLTKRAYESIDEYSPDLLVFTDKAISGKGESISAFHDAYSKAVEYCNSNPDMVRDILVDRLGVKPEAKELIILPEYGKPTLPDEEYVNKLIGWVERVLQTDVNVGYEDLMEGKYAQ